MPGHKNSVRVMLRLNLDDPRMAKARELLEDGVRQGKYKSKSHMIVEAVLATFGNTDEASSVPTLAEIRELLREAFQSGQLAVRANPSSAEADLSEIPDNDAEDEAAVLSFTDMLG